MEGPSPLFLDPEQTAADVRSGSRQALARTITLIESTRSDHRQNAAALLERLTPFAGDSLRVGISGPPGVGKSTLIEALGKIIIDAGHRLAVLSVDPSSKRSGGSILGDKTRMTDLAREERAFIRPSPAGSTLGGVARRTRETLLACEAAGYDVVIVETVGVGQSETAVAEMTDVFLLLLMPEGGDELQGLKKGIFETADVIAVNKADGPLKEAAEKSASSARSAISLACGSRSRSVPVITCSALEGIGIREIWEHLLTLGGAVGSGDERALRRSDQARSWMWAETAESLLSALRGHPDVRSHVEDLEKLVTSGELSPPTAARRLLSIFLTHSPDASERSPLKRLNHVAIAVPDLEKSVARYRDLFGADVSEPVTLDDHGVRVAFVELPGAKVELIEPLGPSSPLQSFLEKKKDGGIHHVSLEVDDLAAAAERLLDRGVRILGGGKPKTGAHGKPVIFLHPGDFDGTLIELEEV